MHGQLVVVLGVENQQVDLPLGNEVAVFTDPAPHDDDQLAMHGAAYVLAVELRGIPLLML